MSSRFLMTKTILLWREEIEDDGSHDCHATSSTNENVAQFEKIKREDNFQVCECHEMIIIDIIVRYVCYFLIFYIIRRL